MGSETMDLNGPFKEPPFPPPPSVLCSRLERIYISSVISMRHPSICLLDKAADVARVALALLVAVSVIPARVRDHVQVDLAQLQRAVEEFSLHFVVMSEDLSVRVVVFQQLRYLGAFVRSSVLRATDH